MDLAFLNFHNGQRATTTSLTSAISQAVDAGVLVAGDKMPSSRELGQRLGIARTTVVRAFDDLIARGYLSAVKGSGTIVSRRGAPQTVADSSLTDFSPGGDDFSWSDRYTDRSRRLISSTKLDQDPQLIREGNTIPHELLPMKQWLSLQSSALKYGALESSASANDALGLPSLRKQISAYLRRSKSIVCHPDQIVVFSGGQSALATIAQLLVGPGQLTICENPGNISAQEHFRLQGSELLTAPVDENGLQFNRFQEWQRRVDWLYLTSACHDPTGAVLSQSRREAILNWCEQNNTAIIEDSWDSDFRYGSSAPLPLFTQASSGSVIYIYSFHQLLYPLSSLEIAVVPESLVPLFKRFKALCERRMPAAEQFVLSEFLASGQYERHIRRVWKEYRGRRQALIFELKRHLKDKVNILSQATGSHLLVQFDRQFAKQKIVDAAKIASLELFAMDGFSHETADNNQFILHFKKVLRHQTEQTVAIFVGALSLADSVPIDFASGSV